MQDDGTQAPRDATPTPVNAPVDAAAHPGQAERGDAERNDMHRTFDALTPSKHKRFREIMKTTLKEPTREEVEQMIEVDNNAPLESSGFISVARLSEMIAQAQKEVLKKTAEVTSIKCENVEKDVKDLQVEVAKMAKHMDGFAIHRRGIAKGNSRDGKVHKPDKARRAMESYSAIQSMSSAASSECKYCANGVSCRMQSSQGSVPDNRKIVSNFLW